MNLVQHAGYLLDVPVVGVEAQPRYPITAARISPPKLSQYPMLRKFHKAEFRWLREKNILALPFDPQPDPALAAYLEFLDTAWRECHNGTSGFSAEANAQLGRILISLLGIYDAWGSMAQFGLLQQHQQVVELWRGDNRPRPAVIGSAHTYELDILQVHCGLVNAFAVDCGRVIDNGGLEDVWIRFFRREIAEGSVMIRDLEIRLPF